MLYMIGIGLADETDVTVKGLEAIKNCDALFLENYTSILGIDHNKLSEYYGKEVVMVDRAATEDGEKILTAAKEGNAALLVIGDVFAATTHTALYLQAIESGIKVQFIPNATIMNAIGVVGLDLYKYGRATTLVFPEGSYAPDSFYDIIGENKKMGLHTLCLLDIKADQEKYMTIPQAIEQLLSIAAKRSDSDMSAKTMAVGCARIAHKDQDIIYGTFEDLEKHFWGNSPHCLIIPGDLSVVEEEMLDLWK